VVVCNCCITVLNVLRSILHCSDPSTHCNVRGVNGIYLLLLLRPILPCCFLHAFLCSSSHRSKCRVASARASTDAEPTPPYPRSLGSLPRRHYHVRVKRAYISLLDSLRSLVTQVHPVSWPTTDEIDAWSDGGRGRWDECWLEDD
jgi:hypothetical protein